MTAVGRRALVLALASTFLTGCFLWTTRGEGNDLLEGAEDRERRLSAIEDGQEQVIRQAKAQVAELETVLEQATKVVTRNSADLGLEVQELREQIGRLEGELAEMRNQVSQQQREIQEERAETQAKLQKIAQKIGMDIDLAESEIPRSQAEHYAAAYRAYQSRDFSRARALFRAYVERYPRDDEADNAQYWIGKTFLEQDRPATALGEFRNVLSNYANSDAVDKTLLDMADAFYRMNACSDAQATLQTLIRSHARSPLLAQARTKLRQVQQAPRGYCR